MDIKSIKEHALAETARILHDRLGVVPDPDSEEWEDEYRRQFEGMGGGPRLSGVSDHPCPANQPGTGSRYQSTPSGRVPLNSGRSSTLHRYRTTS